MDPFREEFELLNALCARRLRLEIEPAPGVKAKLLNDYVADGQKAWLLPNLAFARRSLGRGASAHSVSRFSGRGSG